MMSTVIALISFSLILHSVGAVQQDDVPVDDVKLYQKLFKTKRAEHLSAARSILNMGDYQKQYKMLNAILTAMHSVLESAKVTLEEAGFSPGDKFPKEEKLKNALSTVLENSALFADFALRLPEITISIYKGKNDFRHLVDWSLSFSNSTGFYDQITSKLMHLAGQELGLVEIDPDFVNPYRKNAQKLKKPKTEEVEKRTQDKKKKKKRGPSLSGRDHAEL